MLACCLVARGLAVSLAIVIALALPIGESATEYTFAGAELSFNLSVEPARNVLVESSGTLSLAARNGGGYVNTQDVQTFTRDLVGLWHLDGIATPGGSGAAAEGGAPQLATSPAAMPGVSPVTIVGTSPKSTQGRYGGALLVGPGPGSFGQIAPGVWRRSQPMGGFSFGLWFRPEASQTSGESYLFTRQYNNADLFLRPDALGCRVRNSSQHMQQLAAPARPAPGAWSHVMCVYDHESRTLSLYINGALAAAQPCSAFAGDGLFAHDDDQPIGLGNVAGTADDPARFANADSAFYGALDEVAMWSRALSAAEVAAAVLSGVPLRLQTPDQGAVLVSAVVVRPAAMGPARDVQAVTVDWSVLPAGDGGADADSSEAALRVELSTDRGRTWCAVRRGAAFTDDLHGGGDGGACYFPTVTVKLRVSWLAPATLTALSLRLHDLAPALPPRPRVPMGLNLDSPTYYSRLLPFSDAFQMGAASDWGWVRSGVDGSGWPLEVRPDLDGPAEGRYWVVGRNILLGETAGTYPAGTFTIVIRGSGVVEVDGDGGAVTLRAPGRYLYEVAKPTDVGIRLFISTSSRADPLTRLHVWLPGHAPPPPSLPPLTPPGSLPPASFFHRRFLDMLQGVRRLRFMDWGATNNNNLAAWADRNTPSSASQVMARVRRAPIAAVACTVPPALARNATAFLVGEPLRVHVTTAAPHGLATGHTVALRGTGGRLTWRDAAAAAGGGGGGGGSGSRSSLDTPEGRSATVLVTGPTSFVVSLADWDTPAGAAVTTCSPAGAGGYVELRITPGVAAEVMVALANELRADAWVCVPHLADDDYVARLAELMRDTLQGKLYLEYSNEVWNWIFDQTSYAYRMGRLEGVAEDGGGGSGEPHLVWMARRSVQIFEIFDRVYAAGGVDARSRVVRVIAAQQGGGETQLREATRLAAAAAAAAGAPPPRLAVDALAIAPYFTASNDLVYSQKASLDVDGVLDLARQDALGGRRQAVRDAAALVHKYGLSALLAYEGGQHLGGGGGSCPGGCENDDQLQSLFISANRDWRMAGLYDAYLRMWGTETAGLSGGAATAGGVGAGGGGGSGGDVGAPFMAFSFVSGLGKWGSWGALESMNSTAADSPKWAGLQQFFQWERGVSTSSPPPPRSPAPSPAPSPKPPPAPSPPKPSPPSPPPAPKPSAKPSPPPSPSPRRRKKKGSPKPKAG